MTDFCILVFLYQAQVTNTNKEIRVLLAEDDKTTGPPHEKFRLQLITSPLVGEVDPKGRVRGIFRVTLTLKVFKNRISLLHILTTKVNKILEREDFKYPSPAASRRPLPQGER